MVKENKNNYYTKELNKIEQYILRIFKRYFDIEELNNAGTINFIIQESMKRYKESINYQRSGVDALNGKTGIINVNIYDFKGEPVINKKPAFNKDFGKTEGTICEGNDDRLSNKREPTDHKHLIKHINKLEDTLSNFKKQVFYYSKHMHINFNMLEKISYNGQQEEIDLINIEQLMLKIAPLLQNIIVKKYELITKYNDKENTIKESIKGPEDIGKYIEQLDVILKKELTKTISDNLFNLNKSVKEKSTPYLDIELLNKLKTIANNNSLYVATQYFDMSNISISDTVKEIALEYDIDNVEIQAELLYNDNITKLPYITEDFIIDSGVTKDNNIYIKIQKLKEDAELPQSIANGKIKYSLYTQRDLI